MPAIIAFALGIGSATAMFGVYYNILIDPFPYHGSSRMTYPVVRDLATSKKRTFFTAAEVGEFEKANRTAEAILALRQNNAIIEQGTMKDAVMGNEVSPNTFAVLGVPPLMGRLPVPADTLPGSQPVFAASYKTWQKQMAGDPNPLGKTYTVAGKQRVLVAIMPPRFAWGAADIWQPVDLRQAETRSNPARFNVVTIRKPGVSDGEVIADFTNAAAQSAAINPKWYPARYQMEKQSVIDQDVGEFRGTVYVLLAGAALLLLISCSNVANLLLAQAVEDRRDFSLRAAMGASRLSLVLQFVTDGVVLAVLGSIAGFGIAWAILKLLVSRLPEMTFPGEMAIGINGPVFWGACAVALLVSLLASGLPALQMTRGDLAGDLAGGSRSTRGPGILRLFDALVLNQVVLSLVLLAGAGLLLRSFLAETGVDVGAKLENVLWTWTVLPPERYKNGVQRGEFVERLVDRLRASPGVVGAGAGQGGPPMGGVPAEFAIAGTEGKNISGDLALNSPSFFDVLGVRVLQGRIYSVEDVNRQRQVALINQTMARQHFRGENPLGRRIKVASKTALSMPGEDPWFEIVGVVADVKNAGVREDVVPGVYLPSSFTSMNGFGVFIRTAGEPLSMIDQLRRDVQAVDPGVMTQFTDSMSHWVDAFYFARPRFSLVLISVFTGIGLLLTSIGVYSVVSFGVASRCREVAIRKALGAPAGRLIVALAGRTFALVGSGVVLGYLLSLALGRFVASQLWRVAPDDPTVLASASAIILLIGCIAAIVPSWRASRADPAETLRSETV